MHTMLFGGSRSGKTFWLCRAIAVRAMRAEHSRHLISRFRTNALRASIWADTWPKMLRLCFPQIVSHIGHNKADLITKFPNGAEVWFSGLDDADRVEKILGQEYCTIYLNEVSQISAHTREMVVTRLAQNAGLSLRMYYDCNPPLKTHWTYKMFVQKRGAMPPHTVLPNPEEYAYLRMNPIDNAANLDPRYLASLDNLSSRARKRFRDGEWGDAGENALWTADKIDEYRVSRHPDLQRVIVAIDPSGASGKEGERSDHIGIVVSGLGVDGDAYVLEDLTVKGGPATWGKSAVRAYQRHQADAIIGETNYGGAMVEHVVRTAARDLNTEIAYKEVTATRGKVVRAEPVSALADQGRIHHVGVLPDLEDQLCAFTSAGYMGDRSPDRADAYVWGITELFPALMRKEEAEVIDWDAPFVSRTEGGWLAG